MAYANRSSVITLYCPAVDKKVSHEIISHYNANNRFASHDLSYRCLNMDNCPFQFCMCKYDVGKLTLRD